uniref:Uncharacterized protein n=1 Tax=Pseudonaja textilis TaxID=8673 RepID=A0A670ZMI3_PSETE
LFGAPAFLNDSFVREQPGARTQRTTGLCHRRSCRARGVASARGEGGREGKNGELPCACLCHREGRVRGHGSRARPKKRACGRRAFLPPFLHPARCFVADRERSRFQGGPGEASGRSLLRSPPGLACRVSFALGEASAATLCRHSSGWQRADAEPPRMSWTESLRGKISGAFYNHGLRCASCPIPIILFTGLCVLACCYPLLKLPLPGTGPVEYTTPVKDYSQPPLFPTQPQGELSERPDWVRDGPRPPPPRANRRF